tara:strand:+ start:1529 stop:2050 length:522 start_codon:yes stop_codon:yes gene_type:complete
MQSREEHLAKRKKYYSENRKKISRANLIYSARYRKNNPEKVKESLFKYANSEKGFFVGLWHVIKRKGKLNVFNNFYEFYNHWLEQKAIYGRKCPATGQKMTTKRGLTKTGEKQKRCLTNISTDRILCSKEYSPKNLIFTTWGYNSSKKDFTPKMARAFLKIVEERYGEINDKK